MYEHDSSIRELKDLLSLPNIYQVATVEAQIEGAILEIECYKTTIEQLQAENKLLKERIESAIELMDDEPAKEILKKDLEGK